MSGRTGVNTNLPTPIAPASAAPVRVATDQPEPEAPASREADIGRVDLSAECWSMRGHWGVG
jgi:hypothetical protein